MVNGSTGGRADGSVPSTDGTGADGSVPSTDGTGADGSVPSTDGTGADGSVPSTDGTGVDGSVPSTDGTGADGSVPSTDGTGADGSVPHNRPNDFFVLFLKLTQLDFDRASIYFCVLSLTDQPISYLLIFTSLFVQMSPKVTSNILLIFVAATTIFLLEVNVNSAEEGQAKFEPEKYVPGLCTHIFYAFGWMNEDFTAKAYDPSDVANPPAQPRGYYERFTALKEYDPGLKAVLSFGGRSFPNKVFQAMISSAENRHTFISTAISWVRRFDFDGIDIDWDNPEGDKENYDIFLKAAIEESRVGWARLLITIEVEGKRQIVDRSYNIAGIAEFVDYVLVKGFDFQFDESLEPKTGFNAPLFGPKNESDENKKHWNVADAVNYWISGGMPPAKIVIGIPIFGRGWTLKDSKQRKIAAGTPGSAAKPQRYSKSAGAAAYYEICVMLASSKTQHFFDEETNSSYLITNGNQWFSYEDQQSIRLKLDWLRQNGLAGTYVWALDYDDFNELCPNSKSDGAYPLIGTIARELGNVKKLGLPVEKLSKKKNNCPSAEDFEGHFCLSNYLFTIFAGIFLLMAISASFSCFFIFLLFKLRRSRFSYGSSGFFMDIKAHLYFNPMRVHELDPTVIDIEKLIYSGPNSRVYFGRYRFAEAEFRRVVVKVPSKDAFRVQSIVGETRINAQLRHPRVVEYVGFYRDAFGDVRIVSEFMAGGDLHSFLVDKQNIITVGHLFNFLRQICEGMEYLISKHIVHRDLASRNCMLNGEGTEIKICDFGLSRHFGTDTTYSCTSPVLLPLRWVAIECFDEDGEIFRNCKFSEKTDVWAFGVLIWECFSRGAQPYGEMDFREVLPLLKGHKEKRWRLPRPCACPVQIYDNLMQKCWDGRPDGRPSFADVRELLEGILDQITFEMPDLMVQIVAPLFVVIE
uniref:Protein kinase domain-containing protein n=1 Tax=Globodera rostochiensis TaxID=31243 RepID=A0A914I6X7_GLORO